MVTGVSALLTRGIALDIMYGCDVKSHKRLFQLAAASEETGCFVSRTLPAHAISVTSWYEAAGTMQPARMCGINPVGARCFYQHRMDKVLG